LGRHLQHELPPISPPRTAPSLLCGPRLLDLSIPVVMGILNVTPDSFSDGGRFSGRDEAVAHGLALAEAGAAIIDVGGESTRPGALPVSEAEEMERVVPVIEALSRRCAAVLSVDTSKPAVMLAAVAAGATLINDVRALREEGALQCAARTEAGVCLMHMLGEPRTMQLDPQYDDVVTDVRRFFADRVTACLAAGIDPARLALDPGIGFGKRPEHNLALLACLPELSVPVAGRTHELPILVGVSRKSFIGKLTGKELPQRLAGGIALATAAVLGGASIIRAHDVAETLDAIRVAAALTAAGFITIRSLPGG
jgi:dihydropteroate synthase